MLMVMFIISAILSIHLQILALKVVILTTPLTINSFIHGIGMSLCLNSKISFSPHTGSWVSVAFLFSMTTSVDSDIQHVALEIRHVEEKIVIVESQISEIMKKAGPRGELLNDFEKENLRSLRKKVESLRREEESLRKKEESLRQEKLLLLKKRASRCESNVIPVSFVSAPPLFIPYNYIFLRHIFMTIYTLFSFPFPYIYDYILYTPSPLYILSRFAFAIH